MFHQLPVEVVVTETVVDVVVVDVGELVVWVVDTMDEVVAVVGCVAVVVVDVVVLLPHDARSIEATRRKVRDTRIIPFFIESFLNLLFNKTNYFGAFI